jgi:hypothetical protein
MPDRRTDNKIKLISVESPYNARTPWTQLRNIQYAILCNTHAASLGDATWTPHICNTQVVKFGYNSYIGDTYGDFIVTFFGKNVCKYYLSRNETLRITNSVRQTHIDKVICYTDFGVSGGMRSAIVAAKMKNITVEERKLPNDLMKEVYGQSFVSTIIPTLTFTGTNTLMGYGLYKLINKKKEFGIKALMSSGLYKLCKIIK